MIVPLIFLAILPLSTPERIITLKKQREITCVVSTTHNEDLGGAAVYVNPPVKSGFPQTTEQVTNWVNDDWLKVDPDDFYEDSDPSFYKPITDERWQSLKCRDDTEAMFLKQTTMAVSVYTCKDLYFTVVSKNYKYNTTFAMNMPLAGKKGDYLQLTLRQVNNSIEISHKDQVIQTINIDFNNPYWVYMESSCLNKTLWKLHNYPYRWSNSTSSVGSQESYVNVSFSDNLCLSMDVSIDKNSFLVITLISSNNAMTTMTVPGFNEENEPKTWQRIEINANFTGFAKLQFHKVSGGDQKNGYWAISDIRFCHRNIEIYQTRLPTPISGDHTCELLDGSNELIPEISSFNKPGLLGNVSCQTVLGPSYPFCENHRICLSDSTCFCSWGYQGQSCDKTCDEGTWGLFCTQRCQNCTKCHPSTGVCLEKNENMELSETEFPISVSLFSGQLYVELPNYEEIKGEITYNLKYVCRSQWCENETVRQENYTIYTQSDYKRPLIQHFEEMVPFTHYQPVVTMKRKSDSLEKLYSAIEAQPELDTIKDLSVYTRNSKNLWIKFKPISIDKTFVYGIWYYATYSGTRAKYTEASQCEPWPDFLCARAGNLTSNTSYEIIVVEKSVVNGKSKISSSIVTSTTEEAIVSHTSKEDNFTYVEQVTEHEKKFQTDKIDDDKDSYSSTITASTSFETSSIAPKSATISNIIIVVVIFFVILIFVILALLWRRERYKNYQRPSRDSEPINESRSPIINDN